MDRNERLLGKILGEIYRIQQHNKIPCSAEDSDIYGLLNGFENVLDEQLQNIGSISKAKVDHVMDVLDEIDQDEAKLAQFKGFYDIERKLNDGGVGRVDAISILRYLNLSNRFTNIIEKMNSSNSPGECRTFELSKYSS